MAKIKRQTKADMSAATSDSVVLMKHRNQTVMVKLKQPRISKSPKAKAVKKNFGSLNHFVKQLLTNPEIKALYATGINEKLSNAHSVALSDYLNAPVIHYINLEKHTGAIGDEIRIKATDDFKVVSVEVTIKDKNGKELECGMAVQYQRKPMMWVYTLQVANPELKGTVIIAKAKDRPGNKAEHTVTVE